MKSQFAKMDLMKRILTFFLIFLITTSFKHEAGYTDVQLTWYWRVDHDRLPALDKIYEVKNRAGKVIGHAGQERLKRIWMEGSGLLADGSLINLVDAFEFHNSTYMIVDQEKYPWGLDSMGNALTPLRTIAVDPDIIPLGSKVYIPEFDQNPNITQLVSHDGCFVASDTGHDFTEERIDVFSGTHQEYKSIETILQTWNRKVRIYVNHPKC